VLVVLGEPGIGKSALLSDLVSSLQSTSGGDAAPVLRTGGVESESPLPFAALHRLVRPVVDLEGTETTFRPQGLPVLELTGLDHADALRLLDERRRGLAGAGTTPFSHTRTVPADTISSKPGTGCHGTQATTVIDGSRIRSTRPGRQRSEVRDE
jgi:hypothetical protein